MRLFDNEANLKASGLTFDELDNCEGCQPTHWQLSDTSGFNLCSYHEGYVTGFEKGQIEEHEYRLAPATPKGDPEMTEPYEFSTMVDFARHMENEHAVDHHTAFGSDRFSLNVLHTEFHDHDDKDATIDRLRGVIEGADQELRDASEFVFSRQSGYGISTRKRDMVRAILAKATPAECVNCNDRKCMACVMKEWHNDCHDDCPDCCEATPKEGE